MVAPDQPTSLRDQVAAPDWPTSLREQVAATNLATSLREQVAASDRSISLREQVAAPGRSTFLREQLAALDWGLDRLLRPDLLELAGRRGKEVDEEWQRFRKGFLQLVHCK